MIHFLCKKIICFLIGLLLFFSEQEAFSTVTISNVRNASHVNLNSKTIYGGVAGEFELCNPQDIDNKTTCNNCSGLRESTVCNRNRIYDSLELEITISSDSRSISNATTKLLYDEQEIVIPTPASGINTNDTATVRIPWGNLCNVILGSGSSCDGTSTNEGLNKTITIGFSNSNNTTLEDSTTFQLFVQPANAGNNNDNFQTTDCLHGFCTFKVFPGDSKVFLDDNVNGIVVSPNFPNTSYQPVQFIALRLFFAEGNNFDSVTPASPFVDFEFSDPDSLNFKTSYVEGLQNGTQYVFRAASVDTARNVVLFTPNSLLNLNDHSATPNPVYGLLDGNTNCFIASATFGSKWAPEVNTFREFRNKFLHPHKWGQKLTRWYYKYSPFWANQIQQRPTLKILSQIILWPLWGVITLLLKGGAWTLLGLISLIIFITLPFYFFFQGYKKLFKQKGATSL